MKLQENKSHIYSHLRVAELMKSCIYYPRTGLQIVNLQLLSQRQVCISSDDSAKVSNLLMNNRAQLLSRILT